MVFRKKAAPAHDLVLSGKVVFFAEKIIFFPWSGGEKRPFSGDTWKHDVSHSEEKEET